MNEELTECSQCGLFIEESEAKAFLGMCEQCYESEED